MSSKFRTPSWAKMPGDASGGGRVVEVGARVRLVQPTGPALPPGLVGGAATATVEAVVERGGLPHPIASTASVAVEATVE